MDNKTIFLNKFEELKGQHILASDTVYRLIGLLDGSDDYYWILYDGRNISYTTCLQRLMRLKDRLLDEDYNEILRIAKLNDYDLVLPEDDSNKFKSDILKSVLSDEQHTILAGLYFDLV